MKNNQMTKQNLPKWDLSEIYRNLNDPQIDKDIIKIKNSISKFVKKMERKDKNTFW